MGGGSGGTPWAVGADAVHTHMTNTRLTDPEILEHRYPCVLRELAIRRGSGGSGWHAGGCGMIREVEFRRNLTVSLLTSRRCVPPLGSRVERREVPERICCGGQLRPHGKNYQAALACKLPAAIDCDLKHQAVAVGGKHDEHDTDLIRH